MLHKIADAYGESFLTLMRWAGYVESDESGITTNQARALSYLGDDVSDGELAAIKAVLDAIRARRATFAQSAASLDGELSPSDAAEIRSQVLKLLRRADALGAVPTRLDQVLEVSELVVTGEINLEEHERRQLRSMFGGLVDKVLQKLQGVIHFRAREVWVRPDLHELRKRFVTGHEIGHHLLPWQRDAIAYLDDEERLRPDVRLRYERQANHAAIEILAQGDALRKEADDSRLTAALLSQLSARYQISMQATARKVVEDTRREAALAMRFRGPTGRFGPYHLYCSSDFGKRFGWNITGMPAQARDAIQDEAPSHDASLFTVVDLAGKFVHMDLEVVNTPRALIVIFAPAPDARSIRRILRVG